MQLREAQVADWMICAQLSLPRLVVDAMRSMCLRVAALSVLAVVGCVVSPIAVAKASDAYVWTVGPRVAHAAVSGFACPSVALCVGVDQVGNVISSTAPADAVTWRSARVAASGLSGLSCPTSSVCVAFDGSGDVLASRDPAGAAGTWTVAHVDQSGLSGLSCPSAALCVGVDGNGNTITSTDPAGGTSAWTANYVDTAVGPECGKYGYDEGCHPAPLNGVSCPTVSFCVAVDFWANALVSSSPTGGQAAWSIVPIDNGFTDSSIACPSTSLCVDANGYGSSLLVSTNPQAPSSWSTFSFPSQYGVFGIACPLVTLCYASDDGKTLISSTPSSGRSWSLTSIGINGISGMSCPTSSKCIGVDGNGDLIIGTVAPSPSRTRARLKALLSQLGNASHISERLRRHTRLAFTAPSPGDLSIACYLLPARHRGHGQPRRLLGTATALFKSAAHRLVTIRLTRAGRQLTSRAQLRLAVTASFTPAGQRSIRIARRYTLLAPQG